VIRDLLVTIMTFMTSVSQENGLGVDEWYSLTGTLGLVVLLLIGILSAIVILAAFLVAPRKSKVPALFLASLVLILAGALVFAYVLGLVFSLLVP